jgi:hypothetical protein
MHVAAKSQVVVSRQNLAVRSVVLGNSASADILSGLKVLFIHREERPVLRKGFRAADIGRIAFLFGTSNFTIGLCYSRARDLLRPAVIEKPLLEGGALPRGMDLSVDEEYISINRRWKAILEGVFMDWLFRPSACRAIRLRLRCVTPEIIGRL